MRPQHPAYSQPEAPPQQLPSSQTTEGEEKAKSQQWGRGSGPFMFTRKGFQALFLLFSLSESHTSVMCSRKEIFWVRSLWSLFSIF